MGSLLKLNAGLRRYAPKPRPQRETCEIVIFPGVRIERHAVDLSHRVAEPAGDFEFDAGGDGRPRKTS